MSVFYTRTYLTNFDFLGITWTYLDLLGLARTHSTYLQTYTSTGAAFTHILQNEGVRGFYRGLVPNLLQVMPAAGLQFGAYSSCVLLYNRYISS